MPTDLLKKYRLANLLVKLKHQTYSFQIAVYWPRIFLTQTWSIFLPSIVIFASVISELFEL